ncbi:ferredoxin family protein [Thermanaerothrix sp. 4228-RoL]|nr:4Fe-4S dicluster domain-containing protein [Thermanaerothrix sp. 4228-RoL]
MTHDTTQGLGERSIIRIEPIPARLVVINFHTNQEERMPPKGRIVVNDLYCKGCELCVAACPQEVMGLDMGRITVKGYHPATLVKEGCTGCGVCAVVCPEAAITVYREAVRPRVAAAAA